MTIQQDLFGGQALARHSDPPTSKAAAESVRGKGASKMESVVLEALRSSSRGLTSHELVSWTGLPWNTCTPRVKPLVRKGLAADSGLKRPGPTGKQCVVWVATSKITVAKEGGIA